MEMLAGLEQIVINFDGTIYEGGVMSGELGNIKEPNIIDWPKEPIICNKSFCHCNFDIMCKKELPKEKI